MVSTMIAPLSVDPLSDHERTAIQGAVAALFRGQNPGPGWILSAPRAAQAFREYAPIRAAGDIERDRIYRRIDHGPLLELFLVDMRTYRGPNGSNLQASYDRDAWFIGPSNSSGSMARYAIRRPSGK